MSYLPIKIESGHHRIDIPEPPQGDLPWDHESGVPTGTVAGTAVKQAMMEHGHRALLSLAGSQWPESVAGVVGVSGDGDVFSVNDHFLADVKMYFFGMGTGATLDGLEKDSLISPVECQFATWLGSKYADETRGGNRVGLLGTGTGFVPVSDQCHLCHMSPCHVTVS